MDLRRLACLSLLPLVLAVVHVTGENGPTARAKAQGGAVLDVWPEFGLDPQRSDATGAATGITAANVGKLRDRRVTLPGTIDSSPIYLGGAQVRGATHDVAIVTSSYGRTFALDATTGSASGPTTRRLLELGRHAADHQHEPAARPAPNQPLRLHRLPRRPRPQAAARQRQGGPRRALAGDDHQGPDQGEDGLGAERRRPRRDRDDQRLYRRRPRSTKGTSS